MISKALSLYIKQRFAKGVHRNITDFFKAWITTDRIKIFSITFCQCSSYCLLHLQNSERRSIVLYLTRFYIQHCTVVCFVFKEWFVYDCTWHCTYVADMYHVVFYWKTVSLYCELINLNQFKDKCKPGFSSWTLKTISRVIKVRSSLWALLYGHRSNKDTSLCPFGVLTRDSTVRCVPTFKIL